MAVLMLNNRLNQRQIGYKWIYINIYIIVRAGQLSMRLIICAKINMEADHDREEQWTILYQM